MAMAPTIKVVLGSIAFAVFWVLAVFPAVPILPVGRTAGSLFGGMLMVLFRVISPDQAYAAIDLPILGLLFGTMVVSIYLERADMFKYLGKLLAYKSKGPKDLLCRICFVSAVSSALFTNDTSCVVLTEFVLKIARQKNLPPHPFLIALASSANIGSAATPIGNPQNLVIAVQSKISFGRFLAGIVPSMVVGVLTNTLMLLCVYWKVLSAQKDDEEAAAVEVVGEDEVVSHRFSPATLSHANSIGSDDEMDRVLGLMSVGSPNAKANGYASHLSTELRNRGNATEKENGGTIQTTMANVSDDGGGAFEGAVDRSTLNENEIPRTLDSSRTLEGSKGEAVNVLGLPKNRKRVLKKACVYLITLGMLIALLMGLNMSWTAITAALALVVLDFKDARPSLEKVSYSLLIFFCGMFISVEGFNNTGIPSTLWNAMEPYSQIDRLSGTVVLALVILVLSNVASNVPTVLLLGTRVAASAAAISPASEKKAWLILAWVSTVAGNLSLLGSAANLIVCEQARRAERYGYNLSFWSHLKFGVPSTIVATAIGLVFIKEF